MNDSPMPHDSTLRLSRRRLLAVGGAGAAALWLAPLGGVAEAATLRPEFRRATWLALSDPRVTVASGAAGGSLGLHAVEDLPVAGLVPGLRGHDGAFVLHFVGPEGLEQGIHGLRHPELGDFELFIAPVQAAGPQRRYEAVVDRTVRVAGINEEGQPVRVSVAALRAEQPAAGAATAAASAGVAGGAKPASRRALRLRRVAVRRGVDLRSAVVDLGIAHAAGATTVHALLLTRGRVTARAEAPVRREGAARLRLRGRRPLVRGRHELVLTVVGADGHVTRLRRRVRLG